MARERRGARDLDELEEQVGCALRPAAILRAPEYGLTQHLGKVQRYSVVQVALVLGARSLVAAGGVAHGKLEGAEHAGLARVIPKRLPVAARGLLVQDAEVHQAVEVRIALHEVTQSCPREVH